jgi:hypothetical protein
VNGWDTFRVGIAPQHAPALVAAALLPIVLWVLRRLTHPAAAPHDRDDLGLFTRHIGTNQPDKPKIAATMEDRIAITDRWAAALLGVAAVVHLALPLGHFDGPLLTIGFLGSGTAYAWLALRAREGRRWRVPAALLIVATLVAYLSVVGAGGEEPDQVGIATALVELAALGLALVPPRAPHRPRRLRRVAGSAATLAAAMLVGAIVWIGSFAAHQHADAAVSAGPGTAAAHGHEHGHDIAARAQAGVIMRPVAEHHATPAQAAAAARLAAATRSAVRRFASLDAALAAGYRAQGRLAGTDVHLEHPAYKSDGRILDPRRPEMLVYAIAGGRATLLGVVYVMERAGVPAPQPGGPITGWHAHNLCISPLPPGIGIVTPYGGCPAFAIAITVPEMMHVWTVDNPAGPYAEGLDQAWVRAYHAEHGRPYGRA